MDEVKAKQGRNIRLCVSVFHLTNRLSNFVLIWYVSSTAGKFYPVNMQLFKQNPEVSFGQ
jgi:hypothetical protein